MSETPKTLDELKAEAKDLGMDHPANIGLEKLTEKLAEFKAANKKFVVISEVENISAYEIKGVGCFVKVGEDAEFIPGVKIVEGPKGNDIVSINQI